MRTPIIAGNWKMNLDLEGARALCEGIRRRTDGVADVEKVVCPPFVHLGMVAELMAGSSIAVGAQNVHWEERGAFTGEVSAEMLTPLCTYAIIGHSERRALF